MGDLLRRRCFGAAIALAVCCTASAAETLEDAWRLALGSDFQLAAATARAAAADAELGAARAERYPSLVASSSTSRWRDPPAFDFAAAGLPVVLPLFSGDSFTMAQAHVSVPLYSGGALTANVSAAEAALTSRNRAADALQADIKLGVAEAYIGVLRATSALGVASSTATSLRAHARDVEDMRRTGAVPNNDYLAAAVSLADAEQRELQARNALEVASALYNRHVGRTLDAAVALEPLTAQLSLVPESATLAELVAEARDTRAEIGQLDAAAIALAARAEAARAGRRPQLTVSGGYTYLENEVLNQRDYWSMTLGVRWSLFDAGRTRHSSDALNRQSAAATAERNDLAVAIELQAQTAWQARDTARARIAVATNAVEQAEENLRVVRDRYRNGEGTNTEVLDAEALRTLSLGNLDTARYDASVAELRLAHAVGRL